MHASILSLPDGVMAVAIEDATVVLRASRTLQKRCAKLLEKSKAGTFSPTARQEYQAICDLDTTRSWHNHLMHAFYHS